MSAFGGSDVKTTWVTRRVPADMAIEWNALQDPVVGDLLLCEVVRTGMHGRVETSSGARSKLYAGDRIVCAVGRRYATSMLEAVAEVGTDWVDLISASGVCGRVVSRSRDMSGPTKLSPLAQGFLGGVPVNLRSFSFGPPPAKVSEPRWVVVIGSAMDSGKTTACASLIHGLVAAGERVGAAKLTGTASSRDVTMFRDAGASPVIDFLDLGWPSTAGCTAPQLLELLEKISGHLRAASIDRAVIEIADGLLQAETSFLLQELAAHLGPCEIVLTVNESLAAVAGVDTLARHGLRLSAVSGQVTNSPLASREVELACSVPCVPTAQLGRRLAGGSWRSVFAPKTDHEPTGTGV